MCRTRARERLAETASVCATEARWGEARMRSACRAEEPSARAIQVDKSPVSIAGVKQLYLVLLLKRSPPDIPEGEAYDASTQPIKLFARNCAGR